MKFKTSIIIGGLFAFIHLAMPSKSFAMGGSPLFRSQSASNYPVGTNCFNNMPAQCGGGNGGCVAINNGSGSGGGLGGIFGGLGSGLSGIFGGIGNLVTGVVGTAGNLLGGIGNGIASIFGGGRNTGTNGGVSNGCVAVNYACVNNYPRGYVRDISGVVASTGSINSGTCITGGCPNINTNTGVTSNVTGTNTTAITPGAAAI